MLISLPEPDPNVPMTATPMPGEEVARLTRVPLLRWTYGFINRIVMAIDACIIVASSLIGVGLQMRGPSSHIWLQSGIQAVLIAVIEAMAFAAILQRIGGYRIEKYERLKTSIPSLVPGLVGAWALGLLYSFAFEPQGLGLTRLLVEWHYAELVGLLLARFAAKWAMRVVDRHALLRRTVVLIGANAAGESILAKMLSPAESARYEVVRVFADSFDERQSGTMLGVPISSDIGRLGIYAQSNPVDLVVVALPMPRAIKSVELIEDLQWIAADVVIPVDEIGLRPSFARLATIAGIPTLQVMHRPLKGSQALIKIVEDYLVASVALLLTGPLMLLVALAIRIDSKGPVFFRQERTGFGTNSFYIYKFRTMTADPTDDGSLGLRRDDPRITRVGRILRRLSIDELPQLLNVLRGDMSIVGPRPYVPNMLVGNETFRQAVQNCAFRYRLKPGITGLAQASGMRSNALRSMENAQRSVEMDLQYITEWSIWLDLQIMLRTVFVAMSGPDVF